MEATQEKVTCQHCTWRERYGWCAKIKEHVARKKEACDKIARKQIVQPERPIIGPFISREERQEAVRQFFAD